MKEFIDFFNEKKDSYPFILEIYYSKIMDYCISIWARLDGKEVTLVKEQGCDIDLVFAAAHVDLKKWFLENEGGY